MEDAVHPLNGASIHFSGINLVPERCILLQLEVCFVSSAGNSNSKT